MAKNVVGGVLQQRHRFLNVRGQNLPTIKLQPGIRMCRCWNAIQNCLGKSLPNELEYIVAALLFSGAQKGASPQKFALGKNTDQTSGTYTSVRQDKKPRKGENLSSSDNNS